ncbi:MAG: radical SAM protein [FCB group bacterium]|nr:radical SAM protein [FCB group bacterium]
MLTNTLTIDLDGSKLILTLKSNAFNLFEQPANNLWTFDLEGRLVGMYVDQTNYRRTLDNRFFKKTHVNISGEYFRSVKPVPFDHALPLLQRGTNLLSRVREQCPERFQAMITKIVEMTPEALREQARIFNKIYLPISILPPDQYMALVVQLTEGCNYNRCLFCNFYKDRPFRIKTTRELTDHLLAIKSFLGKAVLLRRSVFLADANAIVTPQSRLVKALDAIHDQFPQLNEIYSFIDVFTGIKKSATDYSELAQRGMKRVYLGVESGNQELLRFLNKLQLTDNIIKLSENLKTGGIQLGIIFLAGIGGMRYAERHLRDSLQLIKQIPLSKGDIVYVSEFHETNPEYRKKMESENITLPDRIAIRQLSKQFKAEMKAVVPKGVAVSIYDINQFFY